MEILKARENSIRKAEPLDARAIVDIHFKTWLDTYPTLVEGLTPELVYQHFAKRGTFDERVKICADRIENPVKNRHQFVHISPDNGRVDGFIIAGDSEDEKFEGKEILALYVLPSAQGKGAGSQLVETALEYLQAEFNPVRLTVIENNTKAIDLYERFGFRKAGSLPQEDTIKVAGSDVIMPDIVMARRPTPLG